MSKVAALTLVQVIILSTVECLIDGKKQTFLPSEKPQKLPQAEAQEAIQRGLAKPKASEDADPGDEEKDKTGV